MNTASPLTNNEFVIRVRAEDREIIKRRKGDRTYAQFFFDVKSGKERRVRVPESARKGKGKDNSWCALKFFTTDEQALALIADAESRGISVSRAVRADWLVPAKNPVIPAKGADLRLKNTVPKADREALRQLLETEEYSHLRLATESVAYVMIAGILMRRETKVRI